VCGAEQTSTGKSGIVRPTPNCLALFMIAFLDTEFTDLVDNPQLLSVGIVVGTDARCEFYAEVTDVARIQAASSFAREAVLPQFGRIAGAACSYAELGHRLSSFLTNLCGPLKAGEAIEVAFESDRDWQFVERAVKEAGAARWAYIVSVLSPVNVYNIPGFAEGDLAASAYFKAQQRALFCRHHALCDARALRIAFDAANASTAAAARAHSGPSLPRQDVIRVGADEQAAIARRPAHHT
jgi:hypothetical protein